MLKTEDLVELQNLVWRYTYLVDDRCYSRANEVFTEDAVFDFSAVGGQPVKGIANIVATWRAHSGTILHVASNISCREETDGTARISSRSLVQVTSGAVSAAFYEDVARRTDKGWRIVERSVSVRDLDFVPTES